MSASRTRWVLLAAVLISLLVHLILAGYIRWPLLSQYQRDTQPEQVHLLRVARITPHTPPPSPAPSPPPVPHATPRIHASIRPPKLTARGARGPAVVSVAPQATPAAVVPAATASAVSSATPAGPCAGHANSGPTVSATPDVPDIAAQVRAEKVSGTAAIRVALDPQGRVVDAAVAQSAGNPGLDAVAVQMARAATYTPQYANCKAVAGSYTFTVKFVAW